MRETIHGNGTSPAVPDRWRPPPSPVAPTVRLDPSAPARVLLAVHDPALLQEVLDFLEREPRVTVVGAVNRPEALFRASGSIDSDATVMCPTIARDVRHPAASGRIGNLLVVAEEMTVPVLRESIEAGASAVFAWPEEREELARTIRSATLLDRGGSSDARGRVVAVFGSKGGCGATFVACHLAAAFADDGVKSTLVDLDVLFGDAVLALGARTGEQTRTIADLVPVVDELTTAHVEDAMFRHARGFGALLAPAEPLADAGLPTHLAESLVPLLAADNDVVVLHVARTLEGAAAEALLLADEVLLVVTPDMSSWLSARRVLDVLGRSGRSPKVHLVLNAASRGSGLKSDVERVVGERPVASVRFDAAVGRAQERGQLLPARSRGAFKDVRALAAHLVPVVRTRSPQK